MRKRRENTATGRVTAGNIDTVDATRIGGWATGILDGVTAQFPSVRIVADPSKTLAIVSGVANGFRGDVLAAGQPTGWCGFELEVEAWPQCESVTLQILLDGTWVDVATSKIPEFPPLEPLEGSEWEHADLARPFLDRGLTSISTTESHQLLGDEIQLITPHPGDLGASVQAVVQEIAGCVESRLVITGNGGSRIHAMSVRLKLRPPARPSETSDIRLDVQGFGSGWDFSAILDAEGPRRPEQTFRPTDGERVPVSLEAPDTRPGCSVLKDARDVWVEVTARNFQSVTLGPLTVVAANPDLPECPTLRGQFELLSRQLPQDTTDEFDEEYSIVIPYFGAYAYLDNCLTALARTATGRVHLVLVDDGTPRGGARCPAEAEGFASVKMIRFGENRGYTAAVNAGVASSHTEKVVILNSDTSPLPGWNEPLLMALDLPRVFAAGPLSNAASHQSVPAQLVERQWVINEYATTVRPHELADQLRREFGRNHFSWDIPNGFCYAVRRADFIELGALDEIAFPRGYGEEVDLMLRALAAGYQNVICPSSFVYHYKSKTFGSERAALVSIGDQIVRERWAGALDGVLKRMSNNTDMKNARETAAAVITKLGGVTANA